MNAFESGARKAIPAVLVYVRRGDQILMLHRNASGADFHSGKWNGLGGKLEADESPLDAAVREVHEESGLELSPEAFRPMGVVTFPNFKPKKSEDWIVFLFVADAEERDCAGLAPRSSEGELHWIADTEVMALNLWPGDRAFLPRVLGGEAVTGTVWYRDGALERSWVFV